MHTDTTASLPSRGWTRVGKAGVVVAVIATLALATWRHACPPSAADSSGAVKLSVLSGGDATSVIDRPDAVRNGGSEATRRPLTGNAVGRIGALLRRLPGGVQVGALVADADSGEVLYEHNADRALLTASNTKLVTVAAALERLGPGFSFDTELYVDGDIRDGVLDGRVVLMGSGDPCLSGHCRDGDTAAVLQEWAALLAAQGVRRVTRGVLLDASATSGPTVHPDWPRDQLTQWYCAPVDAFNINDNCIDVVLRAGVVGASVKVSTQPSGAFSGVKVSCTTTASGSHKALLRVGASVVEIKGQFRADHADERHRWTVKDPSSLVARAFGEHLRRAGIDAPAPEVSRTAIASRGRLLARHRSSLALAISPINKKSHNLFAECLFLALGRQHRGTGSFVSGKEAVEAYLASIDARGEVADGCGLSRKNRYPPRTLVAVLHRMWRSPTRSVFVESLPVAGVDGSLDDRMTQGPAKGRVMAKTGYIHSVSALSGYVQTQSGRTLAFSLLFNGFQGGKGAISNATVKRNYQDAICQILAGQP